MPGVPGRGPANQGDLRRSRLDGQDGNAVKARVVRALNGAGSKGPSQTTFSPNQPTRSGVNSNAPNPANRSLSLASSRSLISAGGRNGYRTVLCAGTPSLAASSSRGAVPADGRPSGGHGQQQRGLPAGTGILDQTRHAGEAMQPARRPQQVFTEREQHASLSTASSACSCRCSASRSTVQKDAIPAPARGGTRLPVRSRTACCRRKGRRPVSRAGAGHGQRKLQTVQPGSRTCRPVHTAS